MSVLVGSWSVRPWVRYLHLLVWYTFASLRWFFSKSGNDLQGTRPRQVHRSAGKFIRVWPVWTVCRRSGNSLYRFLRSTIAGIHSWCILPDGYTSKTDAISHLVSSIDRRFSHRMSVTGTVARRATISAMLPNTGRFSGVRPCAPSTM